IVSYQRLDRRRIEPLAGEVEHGGAINRESDGILPPKNPLRKLAAVLREDRLLIPEEGSYSVFALERQPLHNGGRRIASRADVLGGPLALPLRIPQLIHAVELRFAEDVAIDPYGVVLVGHEGVGQ